MMAACLPGVCVSLIPVLLLIDCEPDQREALPDRALPWTGFERFEQLLAQERPRLVRKTGGPAHFNWFWRMDPQIEATHGSLDWAVRAYARQIADARRAGDGIGLHTHATRWDAEAGRWIMDHGNLAWIERCLRRSFAAYRRAFGHGCSIFRFGDGWFDGALVPLLDELGARIDLTVEPGVAARAGLVAGERTTGRLPDRRGAPQRPYHPALSDFRAPDDTGQVRLWVLPVSTGALIKRPKWRHPVRLLRWSRSPKRHVLQFNLEILPKRFPRVLDRALAAAGWSYVAICVRSDAGTSAERLDAVRQNLNAILRHPLAARFRFMNAEEALAALTQPAEQKTAVVA